MVFYVHAVGADCSLLTAGVANFLASVAVSRISSRDRFGLDYIPAIMITAAVPVSTRLPRPSSAMDRLGTVASHLATGQVEDDGERHLRAAPAAGVLGWLKGLVGGGDGA